MEKKRRRLLPSPAMIVAIAALIVALAGTAMASGVLNKKKVNKIITNRAPGLSVASAKNADKLGGLEPSVFKTASNATQSTTDQTISNTLVTIGAPIQVTTDGSRRLIASAAVHATAGGNGAYLVCHITIDASSGVFDTDFATPNATFTPVDASVSPLASAVVGAGTHTVTLQCEALGGGTPSMTVADDALAAWAVAG